jgi:hypothetical protein
LFLGEVDRVDLLFVLIVDGRGEYIDLVNRCIVLLLLWDLVVDRNGDPYGGLDGVGERFDLKLENLILRGNRLIIRQRGHLC